MTTPAVATITPGVTRRTSAASAGAELEELRLGEAPPRRRGGLGGVAGRALARARADALLPLLAGTSSTATRRASTARATASSRRSRRFALLSPDALWDADLGGWRLEEINTNGLFQLGADEGEDVRTFHVDEGYTEAWLQIAGVDGYPHAPAYAAALDAALDDLCAGRGCDGRDRERLRRPRTRTRTPVADESFSMIVAGYAASGLLFRLRTEELATAAERLRWLRWTAARLACCGAALALRDAPAFRAVVLVVGVFATYAHNARGRSPTAARGAGTVAFVTRATARHRLGGGAALCRRGVDVVVPGRSPERDAAAARASTPPRARPRARAQASASSSATGRPLRHAAAAAAAAPDLALLVLNAGVMRPAYGVVGGGAEATVASNHLATSPRELLGPTPPRTRRAAATAASSS
ncbi:hypothetical protein JL722_14296 [Aureococcus anophagefferens]|nr:hypothetical protein JL722_14296 [Aureococcus anophagefferens]